MPLDRAKTVVEVAQALINSAKVEVELLDVIGARSSSDFFEPQRMGIERTPLKITGGQS
jgi:hypothetical protein